MNRPIDAMRDGQKTMISQDLLFTGAQYTKETWPWSVFWINYWCIILMYKCVWFVTYSQENKLHTSSHSWDIGHSDILHSIGQEHFEL